MQSVKSTPRSRPPSLPSPEGSQQLKLVNRNILSTVGSILSEESVSQLEANGPFSARQSDSTSRRKGASPDPDGGNVSKGNHERRRKKMAHSVQHQRLLAKREDDEKNVRERAERAALLREHKFNTMMENIRNTDSVRVEAAQIIRQQEMEDEKKRRDMYDKWDSEVCQRIEMQMAKFMTRKNPPPPGAPTFREELLTSDDPTKRCLRDQTAEEDFRRYADLVIQGQATDLGAQQMSLREAVRQREATEAAVRNRSTSRPVLPTESWGQSELFASPYGYFAQRCQAAADGGVFCSAKRMGSDVHRPDETDGVQAAGKTRTKTRTYLERNQVGVLAGNHAKEGESARHKKSCGAGSGAPCQDHFNYERQQHVVEGEFPVGKKCFAHLL